MDGSLKNSEETTTTIGLNGIGESDSNVGIEIALHGRGGSDEVVVQPTFCQVVYHRNAQLPAECAHRNFGRMNNSFAEAGPEMEFRLTYPRYLRHWEDLR
jgi:hypothetical protein